MHQSIFVSDATLRNTCGINRDREQATITYPTKS